ncbi:MAG: hypothetical protein HOV67_20005 [Kribbellaceae bacterium]|nr:hypothetical protein [Kribbellaceae bacterium]
MATVLLTSGSVIGFSTGAQADETPIVAEGEHPVSTTMTPGATADAQASGGSYLFLYTAADAPAGGYTATYEIEAPTAGAYEFDGVSSPVTGAGWASPYTYSVNGGPAVSTAGATQTGTIDSQLFAYRYGVVGLKQGSNTVTITVNTRRQAPNTNYTLLLDKLSFTSVPLAVVSLVDAPNLNVYPHGASVTIPAQLNAGIPGGVDVAYSVSDYWHHQVAHGTVHTADGTDNVPIPLGNSLPTGYYRLDASVGATQPATSGSFVITPSEAERNRPADSPFGADLWGSKFVPATSATAFGHVLKLTGLSWLRDRHRWNNQTNPSAGTFDFDSQAQQDAWLAIARANGLKTVSSYSTAPSWTTSGDKKLPQDLFAAYDYAKAAGARYRDTVQGWEIWNEQNRGFTSADEGADAYAAVAKASAIGFADSGGTPQLTDGGLAGLDPHYSDMLYRNRVLDYLDGFAYHTHTGHNQDATNDPSQDFSRELAAARPYGGDTKSHWVTESGDGLNTWDKSFPDDKQWIGQARYLVTDAVQGLANGTTHQFFFIDANYAENTTTWGANGRPDLGQPMQSMAAQSVLTQQLGAAVYKGRLPHLPAGVNGYVFDDRGTSATVLWSPTPTSVTVDLGATTATQTDIMGHATSLTAADGRYTLQLGPDPIYIRTVGPVPGLAKTVAPLPSALPVTEQGFSQADRIVLQQHWDATASAKALTDGYALQTDSANTLTVDVYNFNDSPQTGTVSAADDGGWTIANATQTVTVPAKSKVSITYAVTAGAGLRQSPTYLTVRGSFGGAATSPSVTDVRPAAPVLGSPTHLRNGASNRMQVTYTNSTPATKTITKVTWDMGIGAVDGVLPAAAAVPAGGQVELVSPVAPAGQPTRAYSLEVTFSDGSTVQFSGTIATPAPSELTDVANAEITVDGVQDNTAHLTEVQATAPGVVPANLSAKTYLGWSQANLYLSAKVTDDVMSTKPIQTSWQADGIQIGVAPGWPGETNLRPELQPRVEYGIALDSGTPKVWNFATKSLVPGAQVAILRDEASHTTTYEAAIPWTSIRMGIVPPQGGTRTNTATPGTAASVSLTINDSDDGITRGWINFGDGITTTKDTQTYKPIAFGTPTPPMPAR